MEEGSIVSRSINFGVFGTFRKKTYLLCFFLKTGLSQDRAKHSSHTNYLDSVIVFVQHKTQFWNLYLSPTYFYTFKIWNFSCFHYPLPLWGKLTMILCSRIVNVLKKLVLLVLIGVVRRQIAFKWLLFLRVKKGLILAA